MLMGLVFVPLYIKFLGMEAYGLIGFFATLQALFSILDLGLGATLNRELARASAHLGEAQQTRFLWLSNPGNLRREKRTRLSALLRLNSPIVKGYLLEEDLRRFWDDRSTAWAEAHLRQWFWSASPSRLKSFQQLARMLAPTSTGCWPGPASGLPMGPWRVNNKIKAISHRAFGYRTSWIYMANIYHCCAGLPLP